LITFILIDIIQYFQKINNKTKEITTILDKIDNRAEFNKMMRELKII
jgi:hypothetical protein